MNIIVSRRRLAGSAKATAHSSGSVSRRARGDTGRWASALRWLLAATVLVLVACGKDTRQAGSELLGTARSAATGQQPQLPRPLELPADPIVRGDDTGMLPGGGRVTADGAFTYSVALDVPPALVTPTLSLGYSSRGGNGPVGRGWSVAGSTSTIAVCDKTIATEGTADGADFGAFDSYCLDGKKLVAIKGPDGRAEYRTEDDEMSRILPVSLTTSGVPGGFEVRTKEGRILTYEETYATRVTATVSAEVAAGIVTPLWLLSRETDRSGNAINYIYSKHGAPNPPYDHEFLIEKIEYGPGLTSRRRIEFGYEDRHDVSFSYQRGVRFRSTKRLKTIQMFAPNPTLTQKVWEYTLGYEMGSMGRSLLASVTKCGHEGTCLTPKRFRWIQENPVLFGDGPTFSPPEHMTFLHVFDINGDGRDDVLFSVDQPAEPPDPEAPPAPGLPKPPDKLVLRLAEPGSEVSFRSIEVNSPGSSLKNVSLKYSRPVDADGNGKVDLLAYDIERCHFQLSTWDAAAEQLVPIGPAIEDGSARCYSWLTHHPPQLELVDLNGDSLLDLVRVTEALDGSATWSIALNRGGAFSAWIATGVSASVNAGACNEVGGDFDGDGRAELVVGDSSGSCETTVAIGLDDSGAVTARPAFPLVRGGLQVKLADINGDGLRDAVWVSETSLEISLNTGNGFRPPVRISDGSVDAVLEVVSEAAYPERARFEPFDVNRDGRDDLIVTIPDWYESSTSRYLDRVFALLSRGDGSFSDELIGYEEPRTGTHYSPIVTGDSMWHGDFDRDGRTDVLTLRDNRLYVSLAIGPDVELLTSVFDGDAPKSERASVAYGRTDPADAEGATCAFPQLCVRRGAPVVTWMGGLERPGGTRYRFADLRTDQHGRGSLGFGEMTEWSNAWPMERRTSFDNATRENSRYPYAHRPRLISQTTAILPHGTLGARGCVRVADGTCELEVGPARAPARTVEVSFDYALTSLNGDRSCFVHTSGSHQREFEDPDVGIDWNEKARRHFTGVDDPGASAPLQQNSTYEVDLYGNLLDEVQETVSGVRREVIRTYDIRPAEWLIGLVQTQTERSYDAASAPPAKLHTVYRHNARGLVDEVAIEPDNTDTDVKVTIRLTYDAAGRVRQEKREAAGELPRIWNYEFEDVSGEGIFLSQTWNDLGVSQWTYSHPAYGVLMGAIDANGASSTRIHDDLGRLVRTSSGAGPTSETKRSVRVVNGRAAGVLVATTVASGGRAEVTIDERGQVMEQTSRAFDGRTVVRRMEHDVFGRQRSSSRPGFGWASADRTERVYDSLGRVLSETGPDGTKTVVEPSLFQSVTTDSKGRHNRVIADVDGRPIESASSDGGVWRTTRFTYGPNDKMLTVTDSKGNVTRLGYDVHGRRVSMSDPDAGTSLIRYNGYGEIRQEVDALLQTTVYERDAMGRRRRVTNADGVTTLSWDSAPHGMGQLAKATSADGTVVTSSYDDWGRPSESVSTIDGEDFAVGMTYTADGLRDELVYPKVPGRERFRVKHVYNGEGFLSELRGTMADGTARSFWKVNERNEDGALVAGTFGNGVVTRRTYEPKTGRLDTLNAKKDGLLYALEYDYHSDGRVSERRDAVESRVEGFTYDDLGRLQDWNLKTPKGARSTRYGYDEIGNLRTVTTNSVLTEENHYDDPTHRPHGVTSRAGVTYSYDARGRLRTSSAGLSIDYTTFDLPRHVTKPGNAWSFLYDASGQRVKKEQGAEETVYVGGLYERRTGASGTSHVFRVASPEGEIAQVVYVGPGDEHTRYLHTDRLGSVGCVSDDAGNEVKEERSHFEPFGRRIDAQGDPLGASVVNGNEVKHGFTGHRHDDDLGFIDMRGRMYDPLLRRFLTPDPSVAEPLGGQSHNRYSYVVNDPVNNVDPTGFLWKQVPFNDGISRWVWFDDTTGEPTELGTSEEITVVAPKGGTDEVEGLEVVEPGELTTDATSPQDEFLRTGEQYFNAGGVTSVGDDYSGSLLVTLAAAADHGVRLSDLVGTSKLGMAVVALNGGDQMVLPSFKLSMDVAEDFRAALDRSGGAWDMGLYSEAVNESLRAATDIPVLFAAALVDSGLAELVLMAETGGVGGAAVEVGVARGLAETGWVRLFWDDS